MKNKLISTNILIRNMEHLHSCDEENDKYWEELFKRGTLARERWIGKDWEKVTEKYPNEKFVKYDFSEYNNPAKYSSIAVYIVNGVERIVWEPFYFYAAAVEKPSDITHAVIANAKALYYEKEEEGYGDLEVVLCKEGATKKDVQDICEKFERFLQDVKSLYVDSKLGRISMYMK